MARWIWEQSRWPQWRWQAAALGPALARARLAQGRILGALGMLSARDLLQAEADVLVQDSLTTSAIEGEALDHRAVRSSVARQLGLSTAGSPKPPRHVDGLVEALLDATQGYQKPLTRGRLFRWHRALFPTGQSGLAPIRTGKFRGPAPMEVVSGPMGREKVHFVAPPAGRLAQETGAFLAWFNHPPPELDGLVRAGVAHLWFVTLHPFEDGNGRLARAITDMALAQDEQEPMRLFSLSAQIERQRRHYYDVLEATQRGGLDITPWLVWFLQQVAAACDLAQGTVARCLARARFWLRFGSVDLNENQRKVLSRLLEAGPDGFEGGLTNRKYMGLTKTSRATAYRELADLVAKGCVVPTGAGGRSASYVLDWRGLLGEEKADWGL